MKDKRDLKLSNKYYSSLYSQHGEDGYIAEIFSRIDTTTKFFVEIGIGHGIECNTRLLLEMGWHGLWIDGSEHEVDYAKIRFGDYVAAGRLTIIAELLTPENITSVVKHYVNQPIVDLLSLDTDQHTHCLWRALDLNHRVACIEYNSSLPANLAIEVPYDSAASWDGSNYYGASLKALEQIGRQKGMNLVGCDSTGTNAFFVANQGNDLSSLFDHPFTAENHYERPQYGYTKDGLHVGWISADANRRWIIL